MRPLPLLPILLLAVATTAQRPTPTFEWQKRAATIEFGAVPVGKHALAELPVGETWRLGNNEASVLRLALPLLAGDSMLAPGSYRVQLQRTGETTAALLVNGSDLGLLATGDGRIDGVLGKAAKPTKKLDIQWRAQGAAKDGNQPVQIVVQFGPDEWIGDALLLGHKPIMAAGWKGALFAVPATRLAAGLPTPVATWSRGDDRWNLVVSKGDVKLVPCMAAPTEQFGFGEVTGPDAARVLAGTTTPLEIKISATPTHLELLSARRESSALRIDVNYAREHLTWTVPEPKAKSSK